MLEVNARNEGLTSKCAINTRVRRGLIPLRMIKPDIYSLLDFYKGAPIQVMEPGWNHSHPE